MTKRDNIRAVIIIEEELTTICMPSETKKSVTKKSLRDLICAITSRL
jgi:hypothetical protein